MIKIHGEIKRMFRGSMTSEVNTSQARKRFANKFNVIEIVGEMDPKTWYKAKYYCINCNLSWNLIDSAHNQGACCYKCGQIFFPRYQVRLWICQLSNFWIKSQKWFKSLIRTCSIRCSTRCHLRNYSKQTNANNYILFHRVIQRIQNENQTSNFSNQKFNGDQPDFETTVTLYCVLMNQ